MNNFAAHPSLNDNIHFRDKFSLKDLNYKHDPQSFHALTYDFNCLTVVVCVVRLNEFYSNHM